MIITRSALVALLFAIGSCKVVALPDEDPSLTASLSVPSSMIDIDPDIDVSESIQQDGPAPDEIKIDGWDVVEYFESDGGYITTYAPQDLEAFDEQFNNSTQTLEARQRCGGRPNNQVHCWSRGTRGTASACEYLWTRMRMSSGQGDRTGISNIQIPSNARHICRGDTGGECCATWGSHGSGARYEHLANALRATFGCIADGIFARVENVIIGGGPCTHQCATGRGGLCPPYNGNT